MVLVIFGELVLDSPFRKVVRNLFLYNRKTSIQLEYYSSTENHRNISFCQKTNLENIWNRFVPEIKKVNLWYVKTVGSWVHWQKGIEFFIKSQIEMECRDLICKALNVPQVINSALKQLVWRLSIAYPSQTQITTDCLNWIHKTLVAPAEFIQQFAAAQRALNWLPWLLIWWWVREAAPA